MSPLASPARWTASCERSEATRGAAHEGGAGHVVPDPGDLLRGSVDEEDRQVPRRSVREQVEGDGLAFGGDSGQVDDDGVGRRLIHASTNGGAAHPTDEGDG